MRPPPASVAGSPPRSRDPRGAPPAADEPAPVDAARPALRTLRGRVSYYHDSLAGNCTASGEVYDPTALTAASRDLAFGTVVRVVREDGGGRVTVRVNDRGPFGRDRTRILDLSRAAAEQLDMIRAGVVSVRAEILEEGDGSRQRCRR